MWPSQILCLVLRVYSRAPRVIHEHRAKSNLWAFVSCGSTFPTSIKWSTIFFIFSMNRFWTLLCDKNITWSDLSYSDFNTWFLRYFSLSLRSYFIAFCQPFLKNVSCPISLPKSPITGTPITSELLIIFPYFSYYRTLLILIIHPTSNLSSCQCIIHIADKVVIKHLSGLSFLPSKTSVTPHSLPGEVQMAASDSTRWLLSGNLCRLL